jgi:hypothetical protein
MEFFDLRGQSREPAGLTDAVTVDAGISHALLLRANGTVDAWSTTHYRIAEFEDYGQFTVPNDLNDVIAISAGGVHNLALGVDDQAAAPVVPAANPYRLLSCPIDLTGFSCWLPGSRDMLSMTRSRDRSAGRSRCNAPRTG